MFVHEWLTLGDDRGCIDLIILIVEVAGTAVSVGEPGEGTSSCQKAVRSFVNAERTEFLFLFE